MEFAVLRFVHLAAGVLWAGGGIAMGLFVLPAIGEASPGSAPVLRGIVARRLPVLMNVAGFLTVLSGIRLYMLRSSPGWLGTAEGIVLSLGALLGLGAFTIGVAVQAPNALKLGALGAAVAARGGPPTAEEAAALATLQARVIRTGRVLAWHLVAAMVLMSAMRLAQA